jgi:RNase adapter protein RapZ
VRLVLLTGLSGAGKSGALRVMEDLGYYCVDNLPVPLLPTFMDLISRAAPGQGHAAVCVDSRSGDQVESLPAYLDESEQRGARFETLFLDCADDVLIRRYSETRRPHPEGDKFSIREAITRERNRLGAIRDRADEVIDTSELSVAELRERLASLFGADSGAHMAVTLTSFGFKHGLPREADLVFDVRFLANPYYNRDMRLLTGKDEVVREYVFRSGDADTFLGYVRALLEFTLPRFAAEPKAYLTIAVGCTGGQHRSVAIVEALAPVIRDMGYDVKVRHREVDAPRATVENAN